MEQFDFSEFEAPEVSNKRRGDIAITKVQEYNNLKYRKVLSKKDADRVVSLFHVSKAMYTDLGIDTNALRHFVSKKNPGVVLLGVVADKDGKFLKAREGRKKGTAFKSESLEAALAAAGVIDSSDATIGTNQFIDYTEIPGGAGKTIDGVNVIRVFKLSKGAPKTKEEKAAEMTAAAEAKVEVTAQAPQDEVKAAPAQSGDDW